MATTKNLCAQISLDLHQKISEAREAAGLTTAQYITELLTEYFKMKENRGNITMTNNNTRTLAFQISEELFQRIKAHLERETARTGRKLTQAVQRTIQEKTAGYAPPKDRPVLRLKPYLRCACCEGDLHRLAGKNRRADTLYLKCIRCGAPVTVSDTSSFHQDRWLIRYITPLASNCLRFFLTRGSSSSRMPSWMSWLLAPPMVKNRFLYRLNICPRSSRITEGRIRLMFPPLHSSRGYFRSASQFS